MNISGKLTKTSITLSPFYPGKAHVSMELFSVISLEEANMIESFCMEQEPVVVSHNTDKLRTRTITEILLSRDVEISGEIKS